MPNDRGHEGQATNYLQDVMPNTKNIVIDCATELGFDLVRITSAQEFVEDRAAAIDRIRSGMMEGLPWYNEDRVTRGTDPQALLPGAQSVICLGLNYYQPDTDPLPDQGPLVGKIARYAWVRDYHNVMKKLMRDLVRGLEERLGTQVSARWYVDDGPMLDRAAAQRAGLGWFGKNTNILTPDLGSWVFLGQVITDLELEADQPLKKTCGSCVSCIDACPTGAIVAPYVIDNTKCISYLTIENRGPIPVELRPMMLDWVFGCDICQDVCPVNRKARPSTSAIWQPAHTNTSSIMAKRRELGLLDLVGLLEMTDEEFRDHFRGTPIMRAQRAGLQRNACVALGNLQDPAAVNALSRVLGEGVPLVRGHAAWALGQIGNEEARAALEQSRDIEADPGVLLEIVAALHACAADQSEIFDQAW